MSKHCRRGPQHANLRGPSFSSSSFSRRRGTFPQTGCKGGGASHITATRGGRAKGGGPALGFETGPRRVVSCSTRAGLGGSSARRLAAGALARHTSGLCALGQAAGPHDALTDCTAASCRASMRVRPSRAHGSKSRMHTMRSAQLHGRADARPVWEVKTWGRMQALRQTCHMRTSPDMHALGETHSPP